MGASIHPKLAAPHARGTLDGVEIVILPFFMPLLLIGWLLDDPDRELRRFEEERLRAYERTWLRLFGPR